MELWLDFLCDGMDFSKTLEYLKEGGKATRSKWMKAVRGTQKDVKWIRLVHPEGTSDFDYGMENRPYLELKQEDSTLIPWVATQEDLLAEDWVLLEDMEDAE
ncbi:MAG: DUF2829 domain-containing protein [Lachnospiraceae bacterium]